MNTHRADSVQRALWQALQYFLYNSVNILLLPNSVNFRRLDKEPLTQVYTLLKNAESENLPELQVSGYSAMDPISFANLLAKAFNIWEKVIPQENADWKTLPFGKHYSEWESEGGASSKYWAIHVLRNLMARYGCQFFLRAIIHGSIATLDDTPGFSDMDLAFVIRASVLKNPKELLRLRHLAMKILTLMYAFDPFMHHGPYYLSEIDLAWYPEAMFPSVLFQYGVELLDNPPELKIRVRPSHDFTDQQLDMFEKFFQNWPSNPFILKDSYELEWVLGNTMILPALYLQRRTGEFRYKRDTFPLAEKDFSPQEWEPIHIASHLRHNLGPRPKPPRWLIQLTLRLGVPGLVQCLARRHPLSIRRAQEAIKVLGPDYSQRVLHLLKSMRRKLCQETTNPATALDRKVILHPPRSLSTLRYFDNIPSSPFTDLPHAVPKEKYDAAIEMLVTRWSKLPQAPISIYQIGEVGAPGISDLDFILVFPKGRPIDWSQFQPQTFPNWVQQLITHPPYCCTESAWLNLLGWYPVFNIRYLWGDILPEPKIPEELVAGCALGMLVDYLIVKVPRDFLWIAWERPLRVRTLLAMLHSFKHTLKLAEQAGFIIDKSSLETISKVDSLRALWFELDSSERLEKLARLCAEICDETGKLITKVDLRLSESIGKLRENSGQEEFAQFHTGLFNFTAPWTFKESIKLAYENYFQNSQLIWTNPLTFSQILAIYADECPQFTQYFCAQGYKPRLQWNGGPWNNGLRYHARSMMVYTKSAYSLGVLPQKYIALGYSLSPTPWKVRCYHAIQFFKDKIDIGKIIGRITSKRAKC